MSETERRDWRYWLDDMQECEAGEHGEFWADEFARVLDAHLAGDGDGSWQQWRDLRLAAPAPAGDSGGEVRG